jgi:hypothetical protein
VVIFHCRTEGIFTKHFDFVDSKPKRTGLRVKWADHFGGQLSTAQEVEGETIEKSSSQETPVSWSDRKRRDRLREKELLTKAK